MFAQGETAVQSRKSSKGAPRLVAGGLEGPARRM